MKALLFFIFNPRSPRAFLPTARGCFQALPISAHIAPRPAVQELYQVPQAEIFWRLSIQPGEKGDEDKKKSSGTPPDPPSPICFPGLCLGCFQRVSSGRWGKGLALFTWGCIENRGSVESWNTANPPRVLGGGAGIAF